MDPAVEVADLVKTFPAPGGGTLIAVGGISFTVEQIKGEMPEVKIVKVTVSDGDEDLFEASKSGAEGYLLKDMSEDELNRTLTGVAAGEPALSSGLATKILEEFARLSREDRVKESGNGLTKRELEVLQLISGGATNRETAATLYISENTVNFHMKNILAKLHLKNRAQAVAYAIRTGVVDVSAFEAP